MTIYAVMKTGGKEYRVAEGDVVRVEKLAAALGDTVEMREVSSIETAQGVTVGSPSVAGARVIAEVIEEGHGEKILIFKKKRRDHYQMMSGDLHSYTALRIREIVVPESAYAACAPRSEVVAAVTPPPPPPPPARISKLERKVAAPSIKPETVELRPSARSTETPPARSAPALRVVTEAPAAAVAGRGARKRSHRITSLVAGLVIAAGVLVFGSREQRAPGQAAVEVVTVATPAQAAPASAPPPAAKAPPRKEVAVKKTAAASAPSAPVQPPE